MCSILFALLIFTRDGADGKLLRIEPILSFVCRLRSVSPLLNSASSLFGLTTLFSRPLVASSPTNKQEAVCYEFNARSTRPLLPSTCPPCCAPHRPAAHRPSQSSQARHSSTCAWGRCSKSTSGRARRWWRRYSGAPTPRAGLARLWVFYARGRLYGAVCRSNSVPSSLVLEGGEGEAL